MAAEYPTINRNGDLPEACFETNISTRLTYILFVLFVSITVVSIVVFLGFILNGLAIRLAAPVPLIIACYVLICILSIHWLWKMICHELRFYIVFYPQYVQIGRGWVRCKFPYDDIDIIAVNVRKDASSIKINSGGTKSRVFLVAPHLAECFRLFTNRCNNAVIIDPSGMEHLPHNPKNPAKTFHVLKRHYRNKLLIHLFCSFVFGALAICITLEIFAMWRMGQFQLDKFDIRLFEIIICMYVVSAVNIWLTWKSWKLFSYIHDKQKNINDMDNTLS
jgi:hypothetical protein